LINLSCIKAPTLMGPWISIKKPLPVFFPFRRIRSNDQWPASFIYWRKCVFELRFGKEKRTWHLRVLNVHVDQWTGLLSLHVDPIRGWSNFRTHSEDI
jgi:hypothetical protein